MLRASRSSPAVCLCVCGCVVVTAVAMSIDHKPNTREERTRIEDAGGVVVWAGTWRVGGVLAVSRAFGDRPLKRYVIPTPDIREEVLTGADECLILASDGLWDVISNQVRGVGGVMGGRPRCSHTCNSDRQGLGSRCCVAGRPPGDGAGCGQLGGGPLTCVVCVRPPPPPHPSPLAGCCCADQGRG